MFTSTFVSRWKVPLGLAASVLLAIPLLMQWQRLPSNGLTNLVATAPASKGPAASEAAVQLAAKAPEQASAKQADKDADFSQLAKADTQARVRTARRAAAPHSNAAQTITAPAIAVASAETENEPVLIASAEPTDAKRESFAARLAPRTIVAPRPAAVPSDVLALQQEPLAAAAPAPAKPAAFADADVTRSRADEANAGAVRALSADGVAQADSAQMKSRRSAAPFAEQRGPSIAAADMAPPMPAAAPSIASPTTMLGTADANAVSGYLRAAPAAQSAARASDAASSEKARQWLLQIEKLSKTDKPKEALEEWSKFRQVYPNYPVEKSLLKQIDTVKGDVKR